MATGAEVLSFLCPAVDWKITQDDYDSIEWYGKNAAITQQEFNAGFAQYDAWKAEQETAAQNKKNAALAKLEALGLTTDDLAALGF